MRKYLLLTGIFAVLTYNAAQAERYYHSGEEYYANRARYEDERYDAPHPRYENRSTYSNSQQRTNEAPRYRRMTNIEAREYQERAAYREDYDSNKIRPYIGLDVSVSSLKFGDNEWMEDYDGGTDYFKDSNKAISFVAGAKFNKNWGIEAFYQKSGEEDNKYEDSGDNWEKKEKTTLSYTAYGFDVLGYLPVSQEFELLASLGLAQYDFETKSTYSFEREMYSESDSQSKDFDSLGIRVGIGAQYNFNQHFALRGMLRYVKMNDDEYVKNLTEFSLGLRYMF